MTVASVTAARAPWRPEGGIMSGLSGTANNGVIAPGCG